MRVAGIPLGVLGKNQVFNPNLTLILLHFGGADGSTTFTNSAPVAYTFINDAAAISSTEIKANFGSSGFFDNSGSSPFRKIESSSTAPDLRNTDFTIECLIYPTALNFDSCEIFGAQRGNVDLCYAMTIVQSTNTLVAGFFGLEITHQTTVTLNTVHHVALVRSGNTFALYLDGIKSTTTQTEIQGTIDNYIPVTTLKIGVGQGGVAAHFTGYIDEFRIRKEAMYLADFTPPTAPFAF